MARKPLTREKWIVALTTTDKTDRPVVVEHEIEVAPADQLRAETEAVKYGINNYRAQPLNYSALFVWNALKRLGVYAQPYQQFLIDLYDWDQVRDDDGDPSEESVDPTSARSDDVSSSPLTSDPSSTGSTPTSTSV